MVVKMIRFFIYFILLCLFIISCKQNKDKTGNPIFVNTNQTSNYDLFDFVDSVRFIKLQTTDDNLIGSINKVFFDDNQIIVVDSKVKQILVFDVEGNYSHNINKRGQGPGEYVSMSVVRYDHQKKCIFVYDASTYKMLIYSIDGNLTQEIQDFSHKAVIVDLFNLQNGNFLCYYFLNTTKQVGDRSGLWETDSLGNRIRSFFGYETLYPTTINYDNSYFNLLSDNKVAFRDAITNDVYHFENGVLNKYISFRIRNYNPKSLAGDTYTEQRFTTSLSSQEKGNYIFTQWRGPDYRYYTVYSKSNPEQSMPISKNDNFWSVYNNVFPIHNKFVDSNNCNALLIAISGESILDFLRNDKTSPDMKANFNQLINGMSEDEILNMNPILQLLYIK